MHTYRCFTGPDEAAGVLAEELQALSLAQEVSHIVLSGGSTPQHWFALMAQPPFARAIRWSALHFWWGDERCVAPEDSASNYGQAEQLLFRHVTIPATNIHRIRGENEPRSEALRLEAELRALVQQQQGRPVFDWVLWAWAQMGILPRFFRSTLILTKSVWPSWPHIRSQANCASV